MQVRLSLVDPLGSSRDVLVTAPSTPCPFGAVAPQLRAVLAVEEHEPFASGRRPVHDTDQLGGPGLREGDVLTVGSPPHDTAPPAGSVLTVDVVCGPDAGLSVPLARGLVTVGRGADTDVRLSDPDVSRRHASLTVTAHGVTVHDLGSTNGTQLGSPPLAADGNGSAPAAQPVGTDGATLAVGQLISLGNSRLTVGAGTACAASLRPGPDGRRIVNRPPRLLVRPPDAIVEFPKQPGAARRSVGWIAAVGPVLAGVAMAVVLHNPQFLAFAALSPIMVLSGSLAESLAGRRRRRHGRQHRRRRQADARSTLRTLLSDELAFRRGAHPDPCALLRIATAPESRLWERRCGDADAVEVRLGLGARPAAVRTRTGGQEGSPVQLTDVPVAVALRDGGLGVAGPARTVDAVARWLVAQLATLHAPSDLSLALLAPAESAVTWSWMRWLPHLGGRVAVTPQDHPALVRELLDLLERRLADRARRGGDWSGEWLVLVVDRSGLLADLPGLDRLLALGPEVGITAVCVDEQVRRLPTACSTIARVGGETGSALEIRTRDRPTGTTVLADRVSRRWAEQVARGLSGLAEAHAERSSALPDSCRLLDLLGTDALDPARIAAGWRSSGGRPAAPVGRDAAEVVEVDLAADGPHALVAGTTGSGKSELLQTLVAGLASRASPLDVTFLLVDYKGGAAFGECVDLPHTVGLVTDLDPHLTARALRSLDAEIRRREVLFARAGVASIEDYRRSGRSDPLARLIVVVDEFATLAVELPQFVDGLVSVAQRGRSLGIHLVLATQRPAGVVSAQIRANTALRIALRVTDVADSRDVVEDDSACTIPAGRPGRAVFRTGSRTRTVQVARIAGPHPVTAAASVELLDAWGRPSHRPVDGDGKTDLQVLVDAVREAAAGLPPAHRPWLPPLPAMVQALAGSVDGLAAVGLVDDPAAGSQPLLAIDPVGAGSVLFVGGPRSGRSGALRVVVRALAAGRPPRRLHVHLLDHAGSGLAPLAGLPHVGTRLSGADVVETARFLARLRHEVAARRADAGRLDRPQVLLVVDGWEEFAAASHEHDAGQAVDDLLTVMRQGPSVGVGVLAAGDRAMLSARIVGAASTKFLFRLEERADYGAAGVAPGAVPEFLPPGRAIRASDGAEVQFAVDGPAPYAVGDHTVADHTGDDHTVCSHTVHDHAGDDHPVEDVGRPSAPDLPPVGRITVRPLPARSRLADLGEPDSTSVCWLGVGGDDGGPLGLDLALTATVLVAGPGRSGRTTLLRTLAAQIDPDRLLIAAPSRSDLAREGIGHGLSVLGPDADAAQARTAAERADGAIVLVDDSEAYLDGAAGDALTELARRAGRAGGPLCVVAAGRAEDLLVTYRGVAAEVRRSRCGVLLAPTAADGELLGVRLPRTRPAWIPGRGLAVVDDLVRAAGTEDDDCVAVPFQVALP